MKKYPHGLTLRGVCAAIEAFEAQQDDVPESGMIAAFEIMLTASGMLQRAEAAEAIVSDVKEIICLLSEREWAEHCTKTETGKRLEELITELHDEAAPTDSTT